MHWDERNGAAPTGAAVQTGPAAQRRRITRQSCSPERSLPDTVIDGPHRPDVPNHRGLTTSWSGDVAGFEQAVYTRGGRRKSQSTATAHGRRLASASSTAGGVSDDLEQDEHAFGFSTNFNAADAVEVWPSKPIRVGERPSRRDLRLGSPRRRGVEVAQLIEKEGHWMDRSVCRWRGRWQALGTELAVRQPCAADSWSRRLRSRLDPPLCKAGGSSTPCARWLTIYAGPRDPAQHHRPGPAAPPMTTPPTDSRRPRDVL